MFNTLTMKASILISFSLLIGGCSLAKNVKVSAVDYNRAVANSNDKILLLNIIRASQGRPLHFSRIGKINGTFQNTTSNKASVPFGTDASHLYSVAPTVTILSKANFDIEPLNGKKFWQGLLAPLTMNHLAYFWNQGNSKEMLLHLLVEEVIIKFPNKGGIEQRCRVSTVISDTNSWQAFDAFATMFAEVQKDVINLPISNIGQPIKVATARDFTALKGLIDKGVLATPLADGKVQMGIPQSWQTFDLASGTIIDKDLNHSRTQACDAQQVAMMQSIAQSASTNDNIPYNFQIQLNFRSVAGVIDYLGQHTNAQLNGEKPLMMQRYKKGKAVSKEVLFQISQTKKNAAIWVSDKNQTFAIPLKQEADKSLQSFDVIHKLLALQIEGGEFQPTQSIRFINQ